MCDSSNSSHIDISATCISLGLHFLTGDPNTDNFSLILQIDGKLIFYLIPFLIFWSPSICCKILQWSLCPNMDEREIKCGHDFNYDGKTRSAMFIWAKYTIAFSIMTILSGQLNWSCFWMQPRDFSLQITMWRFISVCTNRFMCKKNSHPNWIFARQNNTGLVSCALLMT